MASSINSAPTADDFVRQFSERELRMLVWGMQSLKPDAREIDFEKFAILAGKPVNETIDDWAKIESKIALSNADGAVPVVPAIKKVCGRKKARRHRKATATPKADDGKEVEAGSKKAVKERIAEEKGMDDEATKEKVPDDNVNIKAASDVSKDLEPDVHEVKVSGMEETLEVEV